MGLIKDLVGAVLGVVQALFRVLLGLVGLGKKSEFFLELDESTASAAAPVPQPAASPKAEIATPEIVTQPKAQAAAKGAQPVAATPVAITATQPTKAEIPADGGLTFATDFLVNPRLNNTSRRRPGPSLSPFASMVKDMKRSASMG